MVAIEAVEGMDTEIFELGATPMEMTLTLAADRLESPGDCSPGVLGTAEGQWAVNATLKGKPHNSFQPLLDDNSKPYLKLEFVEALFHGVRSIRLYNQWQEVSQVQRYLGYKLWRDLGYPAPRSGFATLTLNGAWRGLYGLQESVDVPDFAMARRDVLGDVDALFEGEYGQDFTGLLPEEMDLRYGEETSRGRLAMLAEVVDDPASVLLRDMEAFLPTDRWADFWALEVIVGAREGYTFRTNNFYVAHHAETDTFQLIPWGFDQVLVDLNLWPDAPYARIPTRVMETAQSGLLDVQERALERFLDRLAEPEGEVTWATLEDDMDTALDVIRPIYEEEIRAFGDDYRPWHIEDVEMSQEQVRSYMDHRGEQLRDAIAQ